MEDEEFFKKIEDFKKSIERIGKPIQEIESVVSRLSNQAKNSPETAAVLALMGYLRAALDDPKIQGCHGIYSLLEDTLSSLNKSPARPSKAVKNVGSAMGQFVKKKVSATNKKNASSSKQNDKNCAKEICEQWFKDPSTYKNKAAIKAAIMDKGFCDADMTAQSWVNEFIYEGSIKGELSEDWLEKFNKVKPTDKWIKKYLESKNQSTT